MENPSTVVLVVAAALADESGRFLMQRRPYEKTHGGLWEFPGGKVEPGETPESALAREIDEELGLALDPAAMDAVGFASDRGRLGSGRGAGLVILLYTCTGWSGVPEPREGGELGWFAPDALPGLEMPPLDYPLARALISSI